MPARSIRHDLRKQTYLSRIFLQTVSLITHEFSQFNGLKWLATESSTSSVAAVRSKTKTGSGFQSAQQLRRTTVATMLDSSSTANYIPSPVSRATWSNYCVPRGNGSDLSTIDCPVYFVQAAPMHNVCPSLSRQADQGNETGQLYVNVGEEERNTCNSKTGVQ